MNGFFSGGSNSTTQPNAAAASSPSSHQHWFQRQLPSFGIGGCLPQEQPSLSIPPYETGARSHANAEMKSADATAQVTRALNELSHQEREQAFEDLHGVSPTINETPELIEKALSEMEKYLQQTVIPRSTVNNNRSHLSSSTSSAYVLAQSKNMTYAQNPKLRLRFLRADRFDATKAALRLVQWFQWKLELFGPDKLCQEHIRLEDLDDNGRAMIQSGRWQVLPSRDHRGRAVILAAASHNRRLFRSVKGGLQMMWYGIESIVEDEVTQCQGVVLILCMLWSGQDILPQQSNASASSVLLEEELKEFNGKALRLSASLPMRLEATHILLGAPTNTAGPLTVAATFLFNSASRFFLARFRIHRGSLCECQYELMTFGLPSASLPYNNDGTLKLGNHKKWYQRRVIKENEENLQEQQQQQLQQGEKTPFCFSGIDLPSPTDILLGKGKTILDHRGNQAFQEVMQRYEDDYLMAKRNGGKTKVARQVIEEVKHHSDKSYLSGRFLRRRQEDTTSGWWEEVTEEEALIARVCSGFRNMKIGAKTKGLRIPTTTMTTSTAPSRSTVTYTEYRNDHHSDTRPCCWQGIVSSSSSMTKSNTSQLSISSIPSRLEEDSTMEED
jgi:hypothetical protein